MNQKYIPITQSVVSTTDLIRINRTLAESFKDSKEFRGLLLANSDRLKELEEEIKKLQGLRYDR